MSDVRKPLDTDQPANTPESYGYPAAGPHARPDLINPDATPGAGAFPSGEEGEEVDPGGG